MDTCVGVVLVAVLAGAKSAAMPNFGLDEGYYQIPSYGQRPLLIKPYPGIENYRSDLYEVYMEPYSYDLRAVSAIAMLQGQDENSPMGLVYFVQRQPPAGPVFIRGNITGLPPGQHGFHIHQSGDMRQGCEKLGEHFNPYLLQHGGPMDPLRHVGDLGNIEGGEADTTEVRLVDPVMSLVGSRSVVGRALVVTSDPDDLGRGGTTESIMTGSSGKPLACGIIAYLR